MTTPWRLAVHTAVLPGLAPRAIVDLASQHSYQGIFWQLETDALTRALADLAHQPVGVTGVGFGTDHLNAAEPEQAIAAAAALGAEYVRLVGVPMTGRTYTAAYEATARLCEAYVRAAQARGLRVLLHQRWGTLTASASQLLRVLASFDPRVLGCVYDAGSMTIEGYEEYRIGLEMLGPYVGDVHVANTRHFPSAEGTVWEWEWSPLSDGLIDLRRLFRALRRANYDGWITLADRSLGMAPAARLEADRHILEQAIDDMEGIGSHNPCRPLDDHVERSDRPDRVRAASLVGVDA